MDYMFLTDYVEAPSSRQLQDLIYDAIHKMMRKHSYKVIDVKQSNVIYNEQAGFGNKGLSCILTYKLVRRD